MHPTGLLPWPRMRVRSQVLAYFLTLFLLRGVGAAIVVESLISVRNLPLLAPRVAALPRPACLSTCLPGLSGGFIWADRRTGWKRGGKRMRIRSGGKVGFASVDLLALLPGPLVVGVWHMTSPRC